MARARRSILRITGVVLSLVLGFTWVASLIVRVDYGIAGQETAWNRVELGDGRLRFCHRDNGLIPDWLANAGISTPASFFDPTLASVLNQRFVVLPLWIPFLALAAPTLLICWRDWRACRKVPTGHCRACGYDLSGLSTAAGCPECGRP